MTTLPHAPSAQAVPTSRQRILFVDDEELVLQALRRMLHSLRNDWEMEFAASGAEALQRMAQAPFDVVVSDMRMPGMNGAQLLNEVMRLYPRTIRLILSGHADKDLIMRCVGSTHQYLAKPCDAETLKATVRRASSLEKSLQSAALRQLAARMDRLPSLPTLYQQIVEKLQSPEVALDQIGDLIARDIGMSAKILKLVNSAFFGMRRQISDPHEAVGYLGVDTIKSLVLSIHVFSQFEAGQSEALSMTTLWNHSFQTAAAAKAIVREEAAEHHMLDQAFGAGLLHDTGKLVLACNFRDQYTRAMDLARERSLDLEVAEHEIFGATHADVGGYLLGLWGLPVPVVEAIALHHRPGHSTNDHFSPLTAVHAADVLVSELVRKGDEFPKAPLDEAYLDRLGIAPHVPRWREVVGETLDHGETV